MKDAFFSLGIILTFVIGVWNIINNYRTSRRTAFINTVTAERVKWIERVRESISEFCSLVYAWSASGPFGTEEEQLLLREIDKLSHLIPLQLNPSAKLDLEIQRLIKAVPKLTEEAQQQELFIALEDLVEVEAVEEPHICGWRRRTA